MDDGFTGIDIIGACAQQMEFHLIMSNIMTGIENDVTNFMFNLRRNWASPNAVEFGKNTATLVNAYLKNIGAYADRIIIDIYESVSDYTRINGFEGEVNLIRDTDLENYNIVLYTYTMDAVNHNGQTGMNVRLVEDLINNELPKIKNNALSKLESLPASICIYDETGEQQKAYSTRKNNIRDLVEELLTTIETEIRTNIETEKNNILLAKQQVVQNMSGSSTTNA